MFENSSYKMKRKILMINKYVGEIMIVDADTIRIGCLFYKKGDIYIIPNTKILEIEHLGCMEKQLGLLKNQEFEHDDLPTEFYITKSDIFIVEHPIVLLKKEISKNEAGIKDVYLIFVNKFDLKLFVEDQIAHLNIKKTRNDILCRQKNINSSDFEYVYTVKIISFEPKSVMRLLFKNKKIFYRINLS